MHSFWRGREVAILVVEYMSKSIERGITEYAIFIRHWVGKSNWKKKHVCKCLWNNCLEGEIEFVINGLQWRSQSKLNNQFTVIILPDQTPALIHLITTSCLKQTHHLASKHYPCFTFILPFWKLPLVSFTDSSVLISEVVLFQSHSFLCHI